jgi:hypothetical protein
MWEGIWVGDMAAVWTYKIVAEWSFAIKCDKLEAPGSQGSQAFLGCALASVHEVLSRRFANPTNTSMTFRRGRFPFELRTFASPVMASSKFRLLTEC